MKTYARLLEDITTAKDVFVGTNVANAIWSDKSRRKQNLGKIHPDYSLYRKGIETNDPHLFIVHDKSGKMVGHMRTSNDELHGNLKRNPRSRVVVIDKIRVDDDHRKSVIGHSLAQAAYKHLHRKGYTIKSGFAQSKAGQSIWKGLMADPDTSKHVDVVVHHRHPKVTRGTSIGKASETNPSHIWADAGHHAKDDRVSRTRLVLRGRRVDR